MNTKEIAKELLESKDENIKKVGELSLQLEKRFEEMEKELKALKARG